MTIVDNSGRGLTSLDHIGTCVAITFLFVCRGVNWVVLASSVNRVHAWKSSTLLQEVCWKAKVSRWDSAWLVAACRSVAKCAANACVQGSEPGLSPWPLVARLAPLFCASYLD
jgi:hypothetical protein